METGLAVKQPDTSPIMLALKSEGILKDFQPEQATDKIIDMLSAIFLTAGQKIEPEDLAALGQLVYVEVEKFFPFLKIGELRIALEAGVRGSYGEYFGINIKTIHGWVKAFQVSEIRKAKLNDLKAENKPVKINREKIRYDYWCHVYNQLIVFKETGKIEIGNPIMMFREFWHCQLLRPTTEQVEDYTQQAVYELDKRRAVIKKSLTKKEYQAYQAISAIVEGFNAGQVTKEQDAVIKSKAAELCLLDYFRSVSIEEFETKVNQILTTPLNK